MQPETVLSNVYIIGKMLINIMYTPKSLATETGEYQ